MKTLLLLTLLTSTARCFAQRGALIFGQRADRVSAYKALIAEGEALPRLYDHKDFDSINYYVQQRWPRAATFIPSDLVAQSILLSIQRGLFEGTGITDLSSLDQQLVRELGYYARDLNIWEPEHLSALRLRRGGAERYTANHNIYLTLKRWAHFLRSAGQIDTTQLFFCRVFDGEIADPVSYLGRTVDTLPSTPPLPIRKFAGVIMTGAGAWMPAGHLSFVGAHPSLNVAFGARSAHTEWDLDLVARWGNSANPYTIRRGDSLLTLTYYDGISYCLDYTRYVFHSRTMEFGPTAGVGIDETDFVNDPSKATFSPTSITTLDFNLGFRANWMRLSRFQLAIDARFHRLNYRNPGGTSFGGSAFTLGLRFAIVGAYSPSAP